MKLFILLLVIFFVLLLFRLFQIKLKSFANQEKKDQNIVDLEKDPKTNEYKPKK
jgi:TRAP-type C4-dicarboxylate transport system permease small subunit